MSFETVQVRERVAGKLAYIETTKSLVGISKVMEVLPYMSGEGIETVVALGIDGYENLMLAKKMGYDLASSAEWGLARKYFQNNPQRMMSGTEFLDIEKGFITEQREQTGSFLSFLTGGRYPPDTRDLLGDKGFKGKVALIEFPGIAAVGPGKMERGRRTKITDVTDMLPRDDDGMYAKEGFVHGYDPKTGLVTGVGDCPHPDFDGASYQAIPVGTRMILRGFRLCLPDYLFEILRDGSGPKKFTYETTNVSTGDTHKPLERMRIGRVARFSIDATRSPDEYPCIMAMRFSKLRGSSRTPDLDGPP